MRLGAAFPFVYEWPQGLMQLHLTEGDLLDQPVEVIVNAWNRNIFP
ncbi:MAG: hypothetical protein U0984_16020 [Prosthecobacter sp.]|nr:hypothetical protein [Prosthecobacter sp.]